jgi:hypothetical protein
MDQPEVFQLLAAFDNYLACAGSDIELTRRIFVDVGSRTERFLRSLGKYHFATKMKHEKLRCQWGIKCKRDD